MSNEFISLKVIGADAVKEDLDGILYRSTNLARPMRVIAAKLRNSVWRNFEMGGRYSSTDSLIGGTTKWAEVKHPPTYKRSSKARGITKGDEKGSILLRSTHLRRSIMPESTADTAFVATNVEYAAIQNFGGTTKAHEIKPRNGKGLAFDGIVRRSVQHPGSKITARPYMVVQPEDLDDFEEVLLRHVLGNAA
jgi:phage gpG-like protein